MPRYNKSRKILEVHKKHNDGFYTSISNNALMRAVNSLNNSELKLYMACLTVSDYRNIPQDKAFTFSSTAMGNMVHMSKTNTCKARQGLEEKWFIKEEKNKYIFYADRAENPQYLEEVKKRIEILKEIKEHYLKNEVLTNIVDECIISLEDNSLSIEEVREILINNGVKIIN